MQFPVTLQFKPSRRLRAALVFSHALALLAVLLLSLGYLYFFPALLAASLLGVSLARFWRSIEAPVLILRQDGTLQWRTSELEEIPGRLIGGTAFNWLVVLRICLDDPAVATMPSRAKVLIALADSLSPHDFRHLQIWLRWGLPVRPAASSAEER